MSIWGWVPKFVIPNLSGLQDANSPSAQSPGVVQWQRELYLCRTLYGGWEEVFRQRDNLLPRHPAEAPGDYAVRVARPTFYNAFGRTVRALAGTVFKEDPKPQGVPPEILALFDDDIDLQGTHGPAFLQHTFTDALITGLAGIFVDMPANAGGQTMLEAQQLDLRPFWTMIRKDDIVSFRVDLINGKTVLGQLVIRESVQEASGTFGVKDVERYRVYRRTPDSVTFEIWEKSKAGKWVPTAPGTFRGVTEIPFAPIYTAHVDFMNATPPLIDLANLNLLHYQVNSDLHHAAHIANVPIVVTVGAGTEELQIGPNRALCLPEGASAHWMETTGASIGQTRNLLADIEEQMSNLGLAMLQRKSRAATTAQKASLDRQEQDSVLAAIVSELENGIELALYYTSQFLNLPTWGRFEFARDFQLEPNGADPTQNQSGISAPVDPSQPVPPVPPVPSNATSQGA